MASKKTCFSDQWLDLSLYPEFANWASKVPGRREQAFCKVCKKLLELGNMGKKALITHSKTELHKILQSILFGVTSLDPKVIVN
ncbi:hypothetical protein PR048_012960 [Dryococelus australis]|uniref:Uncharacterized protein n=1 Tax=Dryococelus australis TaxID=614101 RepID=A0ABQ9HSA8_9NEOP|nr:hypothetical protein PR048_012960 [Dryococelus australis]